MTLAEQISLIDAMIVENPDYTIRDFLDLMAELDRISDAMEIKRHPTQAENGPFIFHQISNTHGQAFDSYYRKTITSLRFYSS